MRKIRPIRIDGDVAYIPLTQGYTSCIDVADVHRVRGMNWHASIQRNRPYAATRLRVADGTCKEISLARFLMNPPSGIHVDHIDRNGLNNRRANLRYATISENMMNRGKAINNRSGFKGVYFNEEMRKWRAHIQAHGRRINLGYFRHPEAAHLAYIEASKQLHGEFSHA